MIFSKLIFTFLACCDANEDVHRLSNSYFSMYEKRDESKADHYVDEGLLSGFLRRGRPNLSAYNRVHCAELFVHHIVRLFISIIFISKPIRHTSRKDAHDQQLDRS